MILNIISYAPLLVACILADFWLNPDVTLPDRLKAYCAIVAAFLFFIGVMYVAGWRA